MSSDDDEFFASQASRPRTPDLDVDDLLGLPFTAARQQALARFEKLYLEHALRQSAGNVSRAAAQMGLTRTYAHRVFKRAGLRGSSAVDVEIERRR